MFFTKTKGTNTKSLFPIFQNNPGLIYLDNSATTQKPQSVINSLVDFYANYNANVHRGLYPISIKASEMYEEAREIIADFINADSFEIIFTGGTTDSLNGLAISLAKSGLLPKQPRVLISELEHHANLLPWQQIPDVKLTFAPIDDNFQVDLSQVKGDFDIVSLTHISNVTGTINAEVFNLRKRFPKAILVLDAAQSIAHIPIDVQKLDVDFLSFSGHKMYGPMGIGVLWGKQTLLEKIPPFRFGGGMINEVKKSNSTWADVPEKFEAGTPYVSGAIALAEATKFLTKMGFEQIQKHEQDLRMYLLTSLCSIPGVEVFHPNRDTLATGVVSFFVKGIHSHDISDFLGQQNICVRAGHHCAQVLVREVLQVPATTRISLGVYNDREDINKFVKTFKEALLYYQTDEYKKSFKEEDGIGCRGKKNL